MGIPSGLCTVLYGTIACYYAWDLSYPKQYQVLAFVQEKMFDRREKLFKGISLIKFEKSVQAIVTDYISAVLEGLCTVMIDFLSIP